MFTPTLQMMICLSGVPLGAPGVFSHMSGKSRHDRGASAGFTCIRCRATIDPTRFGTRHRNHCPLCLWSRHLDEEPGDRRCACRSPMEPVGIEVRQDDEWAIIHRCTGCSTLRTNRIAGDDSELALLGLALRPLSRPPFPLDALPGANW